MSDCPFGIVADHSGRQHRRCWWDGCGYALCLIATSAAADETIALHALSHLDFAELDKLARLTPSQVRDLAQLRPTRGDRGPR